MITPRSRFLVSLFLVAGLPATAWATNGYFTHGVSSAEKGLAGAGVAFSQDTLAAANNPAGMVLQGKRYDVGAALFAPMREYTASGAPSGPPAFGLIPDTVESENESFVIPLYGQNWMLDDDRSIGVSVYGNGGMNTEYKGTPGTFFDGTAGVDLAQLFISTTYSAKIGQTSSWGISGLIAYQRFEAKGLNQFAGFSTDPSNLTNNGHDTSTGIGIRIGFQSEISPGIRFGAAYQPKIDMSEFDDYSGLFADDGDFDIPSTYSLGIAFDVGDSGVFLADIQGINYEDVDSVSNSIDPIFTCSPGPTGGTGDGCLGGSNGAGFGWENITVLKLGYQWVDGKMTWRVGYSTTDQPIPGSEVLFNILAPGVIEEHVTFGFTRQIDAASSFDFALMYAPSNSVTGSNPLDPAQEIELEMDQYELVFSYNRRL